MGGWREEVWVDEKAFGSSGMGVESGAGEEFAVSVCVWMALMIIE